MLKVAVAAACLGGLGAGVIWAARKWLAENDHRQAAANQKAGRRTPPPPPPEQQVSKEKQVETVMEMWRSAILAQNADEIVACDRIFRDQAALFTAPLVHSAQADAHERVRAFSTRVLGSLASRAHLPLFRQLLTDPSAYVRENAAWALGQAGDRESAPRLQELQRKDGAPAVRKAAADALSRIEIRP